MTEPRTAAHRAALEHFIQTPEFSCLGARSALRRAGLTHRHYGALGDPESAERNHRDVLAYVTEVRPQLSAQSFRTFVATFDGPEGLDEEAFEEVLWRHLQLMHDIDSRDHGVETGSTSDPTQPHFGFHVGGMSFFLVGMHPGASRASRRAPVPAIAFNSLAQFMMLGEKFYSLQDAIRRREVRVNGSVNPSFVAYEYEQPSRHFSGRFTEPDWTCPFASRHEAAPAVEGLAAPAGGEPMRPQR
ncbi:YqcI/YcgG family protein [Streptomyces sp. RS10V-4]|uniref:guanitoxin biosynthesis heme-dependent pre-guanitoxin N-hydroxylase GntA n=1 Tax=Streptomyces rhizoryzae TaxID=2932493 RepID=UPI0020039995|nr:guanitoxin biosynthesis heme-dependent pre-guanitoxin N-hydroxylase GntA [Streptomyces rhizoryzae]MCK7627403.1 YqcI/YcgG family protein [Streptomyces rhizoryzae]